VLFEEALDERAARRSVVEKFRSAPHAHAADLAAALTGLCHDAHARVATQVVHLLEAVDADHRERRRIVEEPHRHREWRSVRLYGGEHRDLLGGQELLDGSVLEGHAGALPVLFDLQILEGARVRKAFYLPRPGLHHARAHTPDEPLLEEDRDERAIGDDLLDLVQLGLALLAVGLLRLALEQIVDFGQRAVRVDRSEERRVGKECKSWWAADAYETK